MKVAAALLATCAVAQALLQQQPAALSRRTATPTTSKLQMSTAAPAADVAGSTQSIFLDEDAALAQSTFPIKPEALVKLAKDWLLTDVGVKDDSMMAQDFKFAGPVVGPLDKDTYLGALRSFNIRQALPDLNPQFHSFRVDPFEPNRVWFISAGTATHTGPMAAFGLEPTGKRIRLAHQTNSVVFNEEGKVVKYTIGYVMDRELGDTGGLGGIYGILYALGKPLPFREAQPWTPSLRYKFFMTLQRQLAKLQKK